ncbi:sulfatase [Plantactinospora sp. GCM10030261]|uniref:sulfatase n=1 Tax=Plantactinospora sp. GCM10030261 TaxID=3273420 RepID=UPI003615ECE4
MSLLTRIRGARAADRNRAERAGTDPTGTGTDPTGTGTDPTGTGTDPAETGRTRRGFPVRRIAAALATTLAALLVLATLIAPTDAGLLTPTSFLRIPAEALLGVALLLVLPARLRRLAAVLAGAYLGLLALVKIIDVGFVKVLARPFDPAIDWVLGDEATRFVASTYGSRTATAAVIGAVLLAATVLVLMIWSLLRLTRLVVRHDTAARRAVAALTLVWFASAAFGVQIVKDVPVAAQSVYRAVQVPRSLHDKEVFAEASAIDAFRDTPGDEMLTALRGKDVIISFVESYGRDAVADPEFAPQVGAVLDAGTRRLAEDGFAARSAYLTSPTAGGNSWLAHATLASGLWVNNQQRYRTLLAGDRMTLGTAFRRAEWRTVGVEPGHNYDWPEGAIYGMDRVYDSRHLGYRGPRFGFASVPDQYTLGAFERLERGRADRGPLMSQMVLVSSHAPWTPRPRLVGWDQLGDGSVLRTVAAAGAKEDDAWRSNAQIRADYRESIEYSLESLISYVERYGDDRLVLVVVGDHQPAPVITGRGASRDVPITIVTRDRGVLDRVSGWNWHDGLRPGPDAPVWRMDAFRDRFLTTFGSTPQPVRAAPPG